MESAIFSRLRMLLGCITLGAALALCVGIQALFGWGAPSWTPGPRSLPTRCGCTSVPPAIPSPTRRTSWPCGRSAGLSGRHCTASTQPEARAWLPHTCPTCSLPPPGRWRGGAVLHRCGCSWWKCTSIPPGIPPAFCRRAVSGCADRPWRGTLRPELVCVLYPGLCRSACGGYAAPAEKRPRLWAVRPAVQVRGNMAEMDRQPPGQDPHRQPLSHVPSLRCIS